MYEGLVDLMKKNRFLIDAWSIEESGKNWGEADGELCEALDFFNSYIMHMRELDKGLELVDTEEECKCIYIPIGVGVAVPPWNFPLLFLQEWLFLLSSQAIPSYVNRLPIRQS